MKKILIPIVGIGIGIVIFFMIYSTSKVGKTFHGSLTLSPAESALLSFDRYAELKPTEKFKES